MNFLCNSNVFQKIYFYMLKYEFQGSANMAGYIRVKIGDMKITTYK